MPMPLLHTAWNSAERQKTDRWDINSLFLLQASTYLDVNKRYTWVSRWAGLARLSKAMFGISAAALWLCHCAWEGPRASSHLNGSIAGRPHMCVHTHSTIHIHSQTWWALTAERTLWVDAAPIHADTGSLTLVNVWWGEEVPHHVRFSYR